MITKKCISSRVFLLLIFLLSQINLFAQLETSQWLIGGVLINRLPYRYSFTNIPPSLTIEARQMNFDATNSSICDRFGNLKFYTNGIWVANATGDTMMNGKGINQNNLPIGWVKGGLPLVQGALILPMPNDTNKFV